MRQYPVTILLAITSLFNFSCQSVYEKKINQSNYGWVDSSGNRIDTFYEKIVLDSQLVSLYVLRSTLDEHRKPFDDKLKAPITIAIVSADQYNPCYLKAFVNEPDDYPLISYSFFKTNGRSMTKPGPLFFSRELGYGGSGSTYQLFWTHGTGKDFQLQQIYKGIGELTYPYFLQNGNTILILEGIWNMDKKEAHFDRHNLKITKINLEKGQFNSQFLGQTHYKYDIPDNDSSAKSVINLLMKQETTLRGLPNF